MLIERQKSRKAGAYEADVDLEDAPETERREVPGYILAADEFDGVGEADYTGYAGAKIVKFLISRILWKIRQAALTKVQR